MLYFYQTFRFNSLSDYKEFIFQSLKYGATEINPYSKYIDSDGLETFTNFSKVPFYIFHQHIGLTLSASLLKRIEEKYGESLKEVMDYDGCTIEDAIYTSWSDEDILDEISGPEDLDFKPDLEYEIPVEADFPIIASFMIEDSFDRIGSVKTRLFKFHSIGGTKVWDSDFKRKKELWDKKYSEDFAKYCEEEVERRKSGL